MKILLIEDTNAVAELVKLRLEFLAGADSVDWFQTHDEVSVNQVTNKYDLIISDYNTNHHSAGVDWVSSLRKTEDNTLVILQSGVALDVLKEKAKGIKSVVCCEKMNLMQTAEGYVSRMLPNQRQK